MIRRSFLTCGTACLLPLAQAETKLIVFFNDDTAPTITDDPSIRSTYANWPFVRLRFQEPWILSVTSNGTTLGGTLQANHPDGRKARVTAYRTFLGPFEEPPTIRAVVDAAKERAHGSIRALAYKPPPSVDELVAPPGEFLLRSVEEGVDDGLHGHIVQYAAGYWRGYVHLLMGGLGGADISRLDAAAILVSREWLL